MFIQKWKLIVILKFDQIANQKGWYWNLNVGYQKPNPVSVRTPHTHSLKNITKYIFNMFMYFNLS